MRLDKVYIDGFKNLNNVEVDFDENHLTTVIIGQNGSGKSNLIEAITDVFRFVDLNRDAPRYTYEVDYRIKCSNEEKRIRLSNRHGKPVIIVNGEPIPRTIFEREKSNLFPDFVFGYYSGGSSRLERLFDTHQKRYYDAIKLNDDEQDCYKHWVERRLFYCRPIHGIFALLACFAFPNEEILKLLSEKLGITGFHSALALFKEPWYAGSNSKKRKKISYMPQKTFGVQVVQPLDVQVTLKIVPFILLH